MTLSGTIIPAAPFIAYTVFSQSISGIPPPSLVAFLRSKLTFAFTPASSVLVASELAFGVSVKDELTPIG